MLLDIGAVYQVGQLLLVQTARPLVLGESTANSFGLLHLDLYKGTQLVLVHFFGTVQGLPEFIVQRIGLVVCICVAGDWCSPEVLNNTVLQEGLHDNHVAKLSGLIASDRPLDLHNAVHPRKQAGIGVHVQLGVVHHAELCVVRVPVPAGTGLHNGMRNLFANEARTRLEVCTVTQRVADADGVLFGSPLGADALA